MKKTEWKKTSESVPLSNYGTQLYIVKNPSGFSFVKNRVQPMIFYYSWIEIHNEWKSRILYIFLVGLEGSRKNT